ncbi:MAG: PASTA domain-containing protein [Oscillospiraceae bacterium]
MRTIICKKCGERIDASLGECPNCGAVYYILPEDDTAPQGSMHTPVSDDTQAFENHRKGNIHSIDELVSAESDEIFNTHSWKTEDDPDSTRVFKTDPTMAARPVAPPPVRRPVQQSAAPRYVAENEGGRGGKPPKKPMDVRKKQLIVAAVALLAVLTLAISLMSGAFKFGDKDKEKPKMPNVLGQTVEAATGLLEGMDLKVITMREKSDEIKDTVIEQSLKEGKIIKKGDEVTLKISDGKDEKDEEEKKDEYIDVPSLSGKTYDQARETLKELGLIITSAEDIYSSAEVGKIVSQSPLSGAKVKKGDLITVTISKGDEPSPSPTGHEISVTAGKGGSVSPAGRVSVEDGRDQTFTITPNDGYEIKEVKIDGKDVGAVSSYTFTKVTGTHTVYAVFRQKPAPTPTPTPAPTPTPTPAPTPTPTPSATPATAPTAPAV